MVNENKVVELKKSARDLENELRKKYYELKDNAENVSIISDLVDYVNKLSNLRLEANVENIEISEKRLKKYKREIKKEFGVEILEELPLMVDEEKDETQEVVNIVTPSETIVEKKNSNGFIAVALAAIIGLGAGIGLASCNSKNNAQRSNIEETVEESENELNTPEVTESAEVNESINLVLGEYGTFFDVTDNEQVEARAQYIYDNYYAPFVEKLSATEQEQVNSFEIANVIRVMNGELPLDENGNKVMNANIVDEYAQKFTWLTGDLGSSPELNSIYHIPAYLFTTDGSKLQEFVKSYDDEYEKITEGRNTRNGDMTREAIASLGEKFWNEWHLQGMYGDVNPYNFDAKDRLFAFLSSFARYGAYPFEYNLNAMQPVCIDTCIDYNTKEIQKLTVNEIFVGICSGEWDKVIARAAGIETSVTPDSVYFTQDLLDELTWKYNNIQTLKLN